MTTVDPATIEFDLLSDGGADADAWALAQAMPEYTDGERQYGLAVARAESYYGKAWGSPSKRTIELSQSFGLTGYEGKGSNNWGSVQGSGDAGSFPHVDHNAAGKPYVGKYRRYSTPYKGAQAFFRILFGGGTRGAEGARLLKEAIARGDMLQAVREQRANGYFELGAEQYYKAVLRNYQQLAANTGWQSAFTSDGSTPVSAAASSSGGVGVGLVLILAAGVVSYLSYTGRILTDKDK